MKFQPACLPLRRLYREVLPRGEAEEDTHRWRKKNPAARKKKKEEGQSAMEKPHTDTPGTPRDTETHTAARTPEGVLFTGSHGRDSFSSSTLWEILPLSFQGRRKERRRVCRSSSSRCRSGKSTWRSLSKDHHQSRHALTSQERREIMTRKQQGERKRDEETSELLL